MGLPAAADNPRSTPDGAPLLRLHGRGRRSLRHRWRRTPGDAVGTGALARAEPAGDWLGQPADPLHARDRCRDGPGQRGGQRGPAAPVHRQPAAGLDGRRTADHPASRLLRRAPELVRRRRRAAERVRLSHRRERRRRLDRDPDAMDGDHRDQARQHVDATPVLAPVPGPRPADQRPGDAEQPAALPSFAERPADPHRAVPSLRQGPVPRHRRRRPDGLRAGRLHVIRSIPERPGVRPGRVARPTRARSGAAQLHPEQRQDHGRCLRRHHAFLHRRPRRSDHQGICRRLSRPVRAARRDAGRLARAPPRAGGTVQRPDAPVRPLPRDQRRAVLPRGRPVDRAQDPVERADAAGRGLLRR